MEKKGLSQHRSTTFASPLLFEVYFFSRCLSPEVILCLCHKFHITLTDDIVQHTFKSKNVPIGVWVGVEWGVTHPTFTCFVSKPNRNYVVLVRQEKMHAVRAFAHQVEMLKGRPVGDGPQGVPCTSGYDTKGDVTS